MIYLLALLIGVVAGLRAVTPLAAVSWAAALGWIDLSNSWASFMGSAITPWIFTILAVLELVTDQLPQTPSRKVPMQFGARIVTGAFSGAVLGISGDGLIGGLIAGAIGAVLGTLGGAELRARMAAAFGSDRPAGLVEDVIAIVLAFAIVALV
ncbi:DUF4126 family protein [Devosia sp. 1566]|uniref:DUF4126 family protein n=1 Tax=Devosia sp. 1566 TaxID=2499144 RepID=UPI000FD77D97|nr:DUF4126 family protein [Devosia sp. 1566]